MYLKNQQKKYKKQLLAKKFAEDDGGQEYASMKQKLQGLRHAQNQKDDKLVNTDPEGQPTSVSDLLASLRDEFLSDLNADEIPNSDISDVSDGEVEKEEANINTMELNADLLSKIEVQKSLTDKYVEQNHQFMSDFVKVYREDANAAKRNYYLQKLSFDVGENKGKVEL